MDKFNLNNNLLDILLLANQTVANSFEHFDIDVDVIKDIIVDLQLKAAKDEKAAEQLKEWQETQLKLIAELFGNLAKQN